MRRLIVVGILLVLLLIGDRVAVAYAESKAQDDIAAYLGGIAGVEVDIQSFPFVGRLVAAGDVSRLDIRLDQVRGHGIDVAVMRFDARGVEFDRGVLFGGKVRVTDVGDVAVSATITEDEVRRVTGADVRLRDGRATVTVAGAEVRADVTSGDGQIRLGVAGADAIRIPVPDASLLPCEVEVQVIDRALLASCTADELPSFIAGAVVDVG